MKLSHRFIFAVMLGISIVTGLTAQNSRSVFEEVIRAHKASSATPESIEMQGKVSRDGQTLPFRIFATGDEKLRIEYGAGGKDVLVSSEKLNFRDQEKGVTYSRKPSGFAELDITGLFFIQQLANRSVRVEQMEGGVSISGVQTRRIRVQSERTQKHPGNVRVDDTVDLYVNPLGLLAGLARTFYEGRPEKYTQAFSFLDYRETEGVLLPHRIEVYVKGKLRQAFSIDQYRFNLPAQRDTFIPRRTR